MNQPTQCPRCEQLCEELSAAKVEIAANDSHLDELKREHQREVLRLAKELDAAKAEVYRLRQVLEYIVHHVGLDENGYTMDDYTRIVHLQEYADKALAPKEDK